MESGNIHRKGTTAMSVLIWFVIASNMADPHAASETHNVRSTIVTALAAGSLPPVVTLSELLREYKIPHKAKSNTSAA